MANYRNEIHPVCERDPATLRKQRQDRRTQAGGYLATCVMT